MPNCVSKPSAVWPGGVAITPALVMRMLRVLLLAVRNSWAKDRTEVREVRSRWRRSTWPGERMEERAVRALGRLRAVRKSLAPVAFRARAVSMPMPLLVPVMRIVLEVRVPGNSLVRVRGWEVFREG